MPGEKHPIIAHGELYVEPIVKKSRPIDKSIPHEYEDASNGFCLIFRISQKR